MPQNWEAKKSMVSINDKTIIYTTQNGEKVALPPGNTPSVGDMVLVHRLPDGTLITHGNSNIQVGDTVLVTRTQTGEYVAVKSGGGCKFRTWCQVQSILYSGCNMHIAKLDCDNLHNLGSKDHPTILNMTFDLEYSPNCAAQSLIRPYGCIRIELFDTISKPNKDGWLSGYHSGYYSDMDCVEGQSEYHFDLFNYPPRKLPDNFTFNQVSVQIKNTLAWEAPEDVTGDGVINTTMKNMTLTQK